MVEAENKQGKKNEKGAGPRFAFKGN